MGHRTYAEAQIVVIDHEPATIGSLTEALESAGYRSPHGIIDPYRAPSQLEALDPDLLVFEVSMPGIDGYTFLSSLISQVGQEGFMPVLAVGRPSDLETRQRALRAGAKAFLVKPVDREEFLLHVRSLLDDRFTHVRLKETRDLLEDLVRRRTHELRQAQLETLEVLARVAEVRDDATGKHVKRVGRLAGLIAQELHLGPEDAELIMRAALLHDVGKAAMADSIVLKDGEFLEEERSVMRQHAALGAELLGGAKSELLRMAERIAAGHHERWDGQGYPCGLRGEAIPLAARIVAVADAFDAMTHPRRYKDAWPVDEAYAELERERGWQFDPQVVDAMLRLRQRRRIEDLESESWKLREAAAEITAKASGA